MFGSNGSGRNKGKVIGMKTIKFKVAMDSEAAKAKQHKDVSLNVDMSKVSREVLETLACSAQVVRWQAEIRSHWDEFIDGKLPREVEFGKPLFTEGRTRVVKAAVTEEDVKKYLEKLTPAQKLQKTIEMMEDAGMPIPDELMKKLDELTDAEEMEAVAARLSEES